MNRDEVNESTTTTSNEMISFHIVGDAFADLFCFLERPPVPGGDSRLTRPIETFAGGSALNTTTHLCALLQQNWNAPPPPPPATSSSLVAAAGSNNNNNNVTHVTLHTSINPTDEYGKMLLNHAETHGFPLVNCQKSNSNDMTAHTVVMVTNNERSFLSYPGCMSTFTANDLDRSSLADLSTRHCHVHIAGYYNIPGFWNGQLQQTLEQVRTQRSSSYFCGNLDVTTTFSLVPQHDATGAWDGGLVSLLPLLDFLILNDLEADCLCRRNNNNNDDDTNNNTTSVDYAVGAWAYYFELVCPRTYIIVTRGALGAVAIRNGRVVGSQLPVTVSHVVDPTGAGDAFCAGFLHGIWNDNNNNKADRRRYSSSNKDDDDDDDDVRAGLYWGCAVATSTILTRGASVPSSPQRIRDNLDKMQTTK